MLTCLGRFDSNATILLLIGADKTLSYFTTTT